MGSLLFERTGRLSERNHLYEMFNADRPDLIRDVHLEYLQAGATALITNTFAANHTHLAIHGQADRVKDLNRQGVLLAREAIDQFNPQRSTEDPFFVIGSIGPTLEVRESPQEVRAVYQPQIEALIGAGVDALLFETFTSLIHVSTVLQMVHSLSKSVPVVVHMSLHQQAN
ncbi:MAG: homocysteine S-methyltransferase family protein, partial [Candidatus Latescibacterota bacterium]|nr:homocysteine S-methyltransferase family protein [Candidatus Latescibacterota bacterium]